MAVLEEALSSSTLGGVEEESTTSSAPQNPAPTLQGGKTPKPSYRKSVKTAFVHRRRRTWKAIVVHLPSLGITFFIISLTIRNVFWTLPSDKLNTYLNLLQFAAQLHSITIVASLSAILLYVVHQGLTSERGLPFGFLSSSFMLGSVAYPFRREFRALPLLYILLFLPVLFLAMVSSPSSAIIMLPRLQFWSIKRHWINPTASVDFSVYIAAPASELYPTTLTSAHLLPKCTQDNASLDSFCPSYGMRYWLQNTDSYNFQTDSQSVRAPILNRTINLEWLRYLSSTRGYANIGSQSLYMTTTLPNFVGKVLYGFEDSLTTFGDWVFNIFQIPRDPRTTFEYYHHIKKIVKAQRYDLSLRSGSIEVPTWKPFVMVECAGYAAENKSLVLPHRVLNWPPWNAAPIEDAEWRLDTSTYSRLRGASNTTVVNSSVIDVSSFGGVKPSLGIFYAMPEILVDGTYRNFNSSTNYSNYVCTLDARWVPSGVFSDASAGERGIFDKNPSSVDAGFTQDAIRDAFPNFYISVDWAQALTVPWIESILDERVAKRSMLDIIGQKCLESNTFFSDEIHFINKGRMNSSRFSDGSTRRLMRDSMSITTCLQVHLATILAEALARVQDSFPVYFVADVKGMPIDKTEYTNPDEFLVTDLFLQYDQYPQRGPQVANDDSWVGNVTRQDFQDTTRFTEILMPSQRWGYGYGFDGDSIMVYVGAAILLLHAALAVLFMLYVLWRGDQEDGGWRTFGDMVDLAMRSGGEKDEHLEQPMEGNPASGSKRSAKIEDAVWAGRVGVRSAAAGATVDTRGVHTTKGLILRRLDEKSDVEASPKTSHIPRDARNVSADGGSAR